MLKKITHTHTIVRLFIGMSLILVLNLSLTSSAYSAGRYLERIVAAKPVNINHATEDQLQKLKGIGAKRAKAIIAYRAQHGRFKKLNDLNNVPGLGADFLSENRGLITLSDSLY